MKWGQNNVNKRIQSEVTLWIPIGTRICSPGISLLIPRGTNSRNQPLLLFVVKRVSNKPSFHYLFYVFALYCSIISCLCRKLVIKSFVSMKIFYLYISQIHCKCFLYQLSRIFSADHGVPEGRI